MLGVDFGTIISIAAKKLGSKMTGVILKVVEVAGKFAEKGGDAIAGAVDWFQEKINELQGFDVGQIFKQVVSAIMEALTLRL